MGRRSTRSATRSALTLGTPPAELAELGDAALLTELASQYYVQGWTQSEIARAHGLDASKVSRQLKRAREIGIVRIEIRPPRRRLIDLGLGRELADRYGLSRAIVAARESPSPLAEVAAEFFGSLLRSGMRIGVASWSTTLSSVADALEPGAVSQLVITQLAGGMSDPLPGAQGRELVSFLASLFPDSVVHYLHAPLVLDSTSIREALMTDSSVRAALAAAGQSELALVGVGEMSADATIFRANVVSAEDRLVLLKAGAVGSLAGHFFDAAGRPTGHLDGRTIALDWGELRAIPKVVAVASGDAKHAAIAGALRTRCIDVLVTDAVTASLLLMDASS
jgi:deoxyribonucleoside regulator